MKFCPNFWISYSFRCISVENHEPTSYPHVNNTERYSAHEQDLPGAAWATPTNEIRTLGPFRSNVPFASFPVQFARSWLSARRRLSRPVCYFNAAVQRGTVNPVVVGSIPSTGRHVWRVLLWFIWLKVQIALPAGSIPGHTSPTRPNEHWTCPDDDARAQAPGCQRSSCGSVGRGRGGDRYSQWLS